MDGIRKMWKRTRCTFVPFSSDLECRLEIGIFVLTALKRFSRSRAVVAPRPKIRPWHCLPRNAIGVSFLWYLSAGLQLHHILS